MSKSHNAQITPGVRVAWPLWPQQLRFCSTAWTRRLYLASFFYAGLHFLIHEWASHQSTIFTTLTAAVETQRPASTQIRRLLALDTFGPGPRWILTLNSLLTDLLRLMAERSGHRLQYYIIASLFFPGDQQRCSCKPQHGQKASMPSKIRPQVNFTVALTRGAAAKQASAAPPSAVVRNKHSDKTFLHISYIIRNIRHLITPDATHIQALGKCDWS